MLHRFKKDEGGFTLIELLVVILIIGILAAIALPTFLGQQKKGQDSSAKSDARNAVTQVEACFTDTQDYQQCTDATDMPELASKIGTAGQVEKVYITSSAQDAWTVVATSKAQTGGENHAFTITHAANGNITRSCTAGTATNEDGGGCNSGSW